MLESTSHQESGGICHQPGLLLECCRSLRIALPISSPRPLFKHPGQIVEHDDALLVALWVRPVQVAVNEDGFQIVAACSGILVRGDLASDVLQEPAAAGKSRACGAL